MKDNKKIMMKTYKTKVLIISCVAGSLYSSSSSSELSLSSSTSSSSISPLSLMTGLPSNFVNASRIFITFNVLCVETYIHLYQHEYHLPLKCMFHLLMLPPQQDYQEKLGL